MTPSETIQRMLELDASVDIAANYIVETGETLHQLQGAIDPRPFVFQADDKINYVFVRPDQTDLINSYKARGIRCVIDPEEVT